MRDFLYVSERKVDRIAATLPPRVTRRLKELKFNAGPIGAGVVLADQRAETAVAAVIEVEKAIHSEFGIRNAVALDLAAGDWFETEAMKMSYGVQVANRDSGPGGAVFIAEAPNRIIFLSGSAQYLLDRSIPQADAGSGMSTPQAIAELLQSVAEDSSHEDSSRSLANFSWVIEYAVNNLHFEFGRFGQQPLKFLARAISVTESERDPSFTYVLGTPLFVEFSAGRPLPGPPK
jgi:hypothetical protein